MTSFRHHRPTTTPTRESRRARCRRAAERYLEALAYADPTGLGMYAPVDRITSGADGR